MARDPFYNEEENSGTDFLQLFFKILGYWKWIAASVVVCLIGAFVYLKLQSPVYNISSTILLKDDKKGSSFDEMSALQDWGVLNVSTNVDNEIEVLKSRNLLKAVVKELKLYVGYTLEDRIPSLQLYKNSPVMVDMDSIASLSIPISMKLTMKEDGKLIVKGKYDEQEFGGILEQLPAVMSTPAGIVNFSLNVHVAPLFGEEISVVLMSPLAVASQYAAGLGVSTTSKTTSVINLSISETNVERGKDFLNKLVDVYNREAVEDKNRVALNTEAFIEDRLAKLDVELGSAERDMESYKKKEKIINIEADAQLALQGNTEYKRQLVELETQLNLVTYLEDYMKADKDMSKLVPANVGVEDPTLSALSSQYNLCLLERDRLLRTSSDENPAVKSLNRTIESMYSSILSSLNSVRQGLLISKKDLDKQARMFDSRISNVPTMEREYTEKARQQQIKSQLFLILLQKREENSLTLAVTVTNAKVIDDASATGPISPKISMIYMIALVLGFGLPVGVIYLMEILNFKVRVRTDLKNLTNAPVLGEIPQGNEERVAVKENVNDSMAEAFRAVRTNLQFMLSNTSNKVIMVTSSIPGEGKSFVSINLAVSMALVNKKILLIGLDVRKPMLAAYLNIAGKNGATSYLANMENDLGKLIQPSGINANLDILPAGPIPPNPAELLLSERLDTLITELRDKYDYIVIDTAPVGIVSDSLVVGRVADATVYVTRSNVTYKKYLEWLNDLRETEKIPSVSVLLNGVDFSKKTYGYGYGGYGYGYGGYGYGESVDLRKKSHHKNR